MGVRLDLFHRVAAELIADHFKLFVQSADAECHIGVAFLHQFNQTAARGLGVARAGQTGDRRIVERGLILGAQPQILQAQHLPLVHLDAAADLAEVFAKGDLVQQLLHLAKAPLTLQPLGPKLHLTQGLDIGGEPSKPVGSGLVGLDQLGRNPVAIAHLRADRGGGGFEQLVERGHGPPGLPDQIVENYAMHRHVLTVMCHGLSFLAWDRHRPFAVAAQQRYVSLLHFVLILRGHF